MPLQPILHQSLPVLFLLTAALPALHAGETPIKNPSFEETRAAAAPDKGLAPVGWQFTTWSLPRTEAPDHGVLTTDAAAGERAIFVAPTTKGSAGWSSNQYAISPECETLVLKVKVRKSADYAGGSPWVFLTWHKADGSFAGKTEARTNGNPAGQWNEATLSVPREEMPAETTHYRINLAVLAASNGATPAGQLAFDDVRVNEDATKNHTIRFTLRSTEKLSWWKIGDTVRFHVATGTVPDWLENLTGRVIDSLGTTVTESTVPRDALVKDGWSWKPTEPGFYEVIFTYLEKGESKPKTLTEPWLVKSQANREHTRTFQREKFTLAIAAGEPRAVKDRPPQFGFHVEGVDEDIEVANLIGFSFARFWFTWGGNGWEWASKRSAELLLEPERGKFQWDAYDRAITQFRQNGFDVQAVIVNTPKWASPHPEKTQMDICVPGYAAYAPADMNDWTNAVRAIVTHYKKDIHTWELWNEPHLPGFSVFWRDTPEKYVELLKSGYETVKSVQPDSVVFIGGMAHRYLPFYREVLRLGGGAYFDRLGIHGGMQIPDDFYKLDKQFGVKSKPWASTECHALLIDSLGLKGPIPTESAQSLQMLTDFFLQLKHGVERTALFCMINNQNKCEIEVIPFSREERYNLQVAGLFRMFPQVEPRLAAVVMRNFLDHVNGKLAYRGEFELPNDQKAVWFDNGGQPLLFVWNAGSKAAPLDPALAKALTAKTRVTDWEGRTLPAASLQLVPTRAYWLADLNADALKAAPASDNLILSREERERRMKKEHTGPSATYQTQPLFTAVTAPLANESALRWNDAPWKFVGLSGAKQPEGYNARFAAACTPSGLDLIVDVTGDAQFFQESKRGEYWNGDSLQIAIDTEENGMPPGIMDFIVALTKDGPVLWKSTAPSLGGDLPARWTPGNQPVQFGAAAVEKLADGKLRYKVHIDWNELYPLVWKDGKTLFLSLLVNDNDGAGRTGWIEWASGIGGDRDPSLYGKLTPTP